MKAAAGRGEGEGVKLECITYSFGENMLPSFLRPVFRMSSKRSIALTYDVII